VLPAGGKKKRAQNANTRREEVKTRLLSGTRPLNHQPADSHLSPKQQPSPSSDGRPSGPKVIPPDHEIWVLSEKTCKPSTQLLHSRSQTSASHDLNASPSIGVSRRLEGGAGPSSPDQSLTTRRPSSNAITTSRTGRKYAL